MSQNVTETMAGASIMLPPHKCKLKLLSRYVGSSKIKQRDFYTGARRLYGRKVPILHLFANIPAAFRKSKKHVAGAHIRFIDVEKARAESICNPSSRS